MPWSVLDSEAYARLNYPAQSLLMVFARQLGRNNNGRLVCSRQFMKEKGWKSWDVVDRAKKELIEAE